jgi:hypothetical protein
VKVRRARSGVHLGPGETELARAEGPAGTIVGTRDALYLPDGAGHLRLGWERVESAGWSSESETLRVRELVAWGEAKPTHEVRIADPGRLLELVRERVTASVLLQRHVAVTGSRGVRVIGRRAPSGARAVTWLLEYDEGIDPSDEAVVRTAEALLASAREETGL